MPSVLVLGDEASILAALQASARLSGVVIDSRLSRAAALEAVRAAEVAVVVTDPSAPLSDDLALANEFDRLRPGIKVVSLALSTTPEELTLALRAGIFACFTAPFDLREVEHLVALALETGGLQDRIEVISGLPHWLTLRATCLRVTAERLIRYMTEYQADLPDADRFELMTAFREILQNAMEHGCGFDGEKMVEVSAIRTARAMVCHVRDPGEGFPREPLAHAAIANEPDAPLAHVEHRAQRGMRPGGFGILLVRQIVDELAYNERGNEVIFIKYRRPAPA